MTKMPNAKDSERFPATPPLPLFRLDGAVAVCRGCGRVYEGTATFAIAHARDCQHQRLFDAIYRLERHYRPEAGYGGDALAADPRADIVFAILGEGACPAEPDVPVDAVDAGIDADDMAWCMTFVVDARSRGGLLNAPRGRWACSIADIKAQQPGSFANVVGVVVAISRDLDVAVVTLRDDTGDLHAEITRKGVGGASFDAVMPHLGCGHVIAATGITAPTPRPLLLVDRIIDRGDRVEIKRSNAIDLPSIRGAVEDHAKDTRPAAPGVRAADTQYQELWAAITDADLGAGFWAAPLPTTVHEARLVVARRIAAAAAATAADAAARQCTSTIRLRGELRRCRLPMGHQEEHVDMENGIWTAHWKSTDDGVVEWSER